MKFAVMPMIVIRHMACMTRTTVYVMPRAPWFESFILAVFSGVLGMLRNASAFAMVLEMDREFDDGACFGVERLQRGSRLDNLSRGCLNER